MSLDLLSKQREALRKIADADVTEKPQTVAYAMQRIARAALHTPDSAEEFTDAYSVESQRAQAVRRLRHP